MTHRNGCSFVVKSKIWSEKNTSLIYNFLIQKTNKLPKNRAAFD